MKIITAPKLPDGYEAFLYSCDVRSLVGSWSATVLLSTAPALGDGWSVPGVMEGGILTSAVKKGEAADGRTYWALGGYDAGFKLMTSAPLAHQVQASELGAVIRELIEGCGLAADVTLERTLDVDARYLVSGDTVANAVLDLALIGGAVACVTADGTVKVAPPRACGEFPTRGLTIDDVESKSLDTDGYASGVIVTLGRRAKSKSSKSTSASSIYNDKNTVQTGSLTRESQSGVSSITAGTLSWSYTMLKPLGVIEEFNAELWLPGIGVSKVFSSSYEYDVETTLLRTGEKQSRVWKYCLTSASAVESTEINATYYDSATGKTATETVKRIAEHTVERSYDVDKTHILSETSTTKIYDPDVGMKEPFTSRTQRDWTWEDDSNYRAVLERSWQYSEKDVGQADVVRDPATSKPLTIKLADGTDSYVLLNGNQATMQIKSESVTNTEEIFNDDGECVMRIERSTDDDGLNDMLSRGLFGDLYDAKNTQVKAAMAQLRNLSQSGSMRIQQMPGSSSISTEVETQTMEGDTYKADTTASSGSSYKKRYVEGTFAQEVCPFLCSDGTCGVISEPAAASVNESSGSLVEDGVEYASTYWNSDGTTTTANKGSKCTKLDSDGGTPNYENCPKYTSLKFMAASTAGSGAGVPVIGLAGDGAIWTEKEVYIDEELSDNDALILARQIAENILAVKQVSRGIIESVTIPLNVNINPDGGVMGVSHDFGSLRTTLSYRPHDTTPPDYIMLLTTASAALNVFDKANIAKGRSAYGRVVDVRPDRALVILGGRPVSCTSSLSIKRGDNVLVFMPPGSVANGIVQAVM